LNLDLMDLDSTMSPAQNHPRQRRGADLSGHANNQA
jgi:hypothetical protein